MSPKNTMLYVLFLLITLHSDGYADDYENKGGIEGKHNVPLKNGNLSNGTRGSQQGRANSAMQNKKECLYDRSKLCVPCHYITTWTMLVSVRLETGRGK